MRPSKIAKQNVLEVTILIIFKLLIILCQLNIGIRFLKADDEKIFHRSYCLFRKIYNKNMSLNVHITYKKSAHPPGNRFQRVFDFWYVEMKAHCSLFHLIDPFS